uniref:Uncharacterized protein n=1 Tax=Anguilla anguilla TaxID=7936 RepID=A0A0E9VQH7_ANGAN
MSHHAKIFPWCMHCHRRGLILKFTLRLR